MNWIKMLFSVITLFCVFFLNFNLNVAMAEEPMCSKFSCEEQLLEKMIRQEIKVEQMQNDIKKTQESVSDSLAEMAKTQEDVSKALKDLTKNEIRKTPTAAFFAHNVADLKLDKTGKIIVFTTTTTNKGSGYDTSTGIFTAPVGGLYQFIVNYCSPPDRHSPIALVISGNVVARSSNYNKGHSACSAFSAVVEVKSKEKIWVKCLESSSNYALHQDGWKMNSFNGILVIT